MLANCASLRSTITSMQHSLYTVAGRIDGIARSPLWMFVTSLCTVPIIAVRGLWLYRSEEPNLVPKRCLTVLCMRWHILRTFRHAINCNCYQLKFFIRYTLAIHDLHATMLLVNLTARLLQQSRPFNWFIVSFLNVSFDNLLPQRLVFCPT